MHRLGILLLLFLSLLQGKSFSQSTFYRTVGTSSGEEGHCVAQCTDGGYFLSTSIDPNGTFNAGIIKTDCAGLLKWSKIYNTGYACYGYDIIPLPDSGCVFTFYSDVIPHSTTVIQLDKFGNPRWTSTIILKGNYLQGSIVRDDDGNLYLCGNIIDTLSTYVTCLVKLNSMGQICWTKKYSDVYGNGSRCLKLLNNNMLVVAGVKGFVNLFFTDAFLMLCDTAGNQLSRKLIGTPYDDEVITMTTDDNDNIYLSGRSYFMLSQWDVMYWKFDSQLNLLQCRFFDGATQEGENIRDIIYSSDNHILIFGDEGGFNERNLLVAKLDIQGSVTWSKEYQVSTQFTNYLYSGVECSDGGYLMTGDIRPISLHRTSPLMKMDENGNLGCTDFPFVLSHHDEIPLMADSNSLVNQISVSIDFTPATVSSVLVQQHTFCDASYPCASFVQQLTDTTCNTACFDFIDSSSNANSWEWSFEGGNPSGSFDQNPSEICFDKPGIYQVTLLAKNNFGTDFYTRQIRVDDNCPVVIPNVITPDGNDKNETWKLTGVKGDYSLKVFNRWGKVVFSAELYSNNFNGETNDGSKLTQGVYYYVLESTSHEKEYHGVIHILD